MRPELSKRLAQEYEACESDLKKPIDLLERIVSNDDFIDCAVIGGVNVAEIVAGKVHEWQIPASVKYAFELQYPNLHESFAHAVQRLSAHPEKLRGLVNGVRGKLFEVNYVDYLNHGHLASGFTAHLAHSSTNAIWDVCITDAQGHVDQLYQLKASAVIAAARHALAAHPNVDVVIPSDVLHHVADHAHLVEHLHDGHETLTHLDGVMDQGIHDGNLAAVHFHVPYISFVVIAFTTFQQYRNGKLNSEQAVVKMTQRVATSALATAAGWVAQALLHKTIIGIPVAIYARWKMGKWFQKSDLRKVIDMKITIVIDSRLGLRGKIDGRRVTGLLSS